MDLFQALILGIVQGITEFFPISSSGHLILLPRLLGWSEHSLAFDSVLHLGTGLAVLSYFCRDWLNMLQSLFSDIRHTRYDIRKFSGASQQLLFIALASIPAGLAGFLFSNFVEANLRSPQIVVGTLFIVALLMLLAEKLSSQFKKGTDPLSALVIGFSQVLALVPGVSRSGITMVAGLFCGLKREEAARFSFLLATPVVLAAGFWGLFKIEQLTINYQLLTIGFFASFLSGLLAIKFFLKLVERWGLGPFAIYRILLAIFIFVT